MDCRRPVTFEKIVLHRVVFLVSPGEHDSELPSSYIYAAEASDAEFMEGAPSRAVCGEPYRRVLTAYFLRCRERRSQ